VALAIKDGKLVDIAPVEDEGDGTYTVSVCPMETGTFIVETAPADRWVWSIINREWWHEKLNALLNGFLNTDTGKWVSIQKIVNK